MKVTESELRAMRERVRGGGATAPTKAGTATVARASVCAGSNPAPSPYRSKLEAAHASFLHVLMLAGDIQLYRYEPVRLKLSEGIYYIPDFWVRWKDGTEEYREIKGHTKSLMQRAGMLKVKLAAAHWPFWRFIVVTRYRGQWEQRVMGYENQAVMEA